MTQNSMILELLHDWLSPAEAFRETGSMKLSTRVSDFRKAGYEIESRKVTKKNRFGKTIHYNEYRIKEA